MKPERLLCSFVLLFALQIAYAGPSRPGMRTFVQPDGTSLRAEIRGDEFGSLMISSDGCAVSLGRDGFYYYTSYPAGHRNVSPYIYGRKAPSDVIAASRNVPFSMIGGRAHASRARRSFIPEYRTRGGGNAHSAVILLAQFSDLKFTYENKSAYSAIAQKAADYFTDQYMGEGTFRFDVGPIVTASKGYAYYGADTDEEDDAKAYELVAEACKLSDSEVDFSSYDAIFIIYAGGSPADGSADADHIWPHAWNLKKAGVSLVLDGVKIGDYALSSELQLRQSDGKTVQNGIGSFCHEYCHTLGLVDMYDVDYEDSGGWADGLWGFTDIMDVGNYNDDSNTPPHFNAIELDLLGLGECIRLSPGVVTLPPVHESNRYLRMDSDNEGEYFLFECRQQTGWDAFIGGSGLLVYHIDKSSNQSGYSSLQDRNLTAAERWKLNEVNGRPDHECADLVEASRPRSTDYSEVYSIFFPGRNSSHSSFTPETSPAFLLWDGTSPSYSIESISMNGNSVTLSVAGPVAVDVQKVYQDAVILGWSTQTDSFIGSTAALSYRSPEGETVSVDVNPYEGGKYAYVLEGLSPVTSYEACISMTSKNGETTEISVPFTTKAYYEQGLPFIYLNDTERYISGAFYDGSKLPLRVYNARNASSVEWYMDSSRICAGPDGFYTVHNSGVLRAVINYADGSTEVIQKKITVK